MSHNEGNCCGGLGLRVLTGCRGMKTHSRPVEGELVIRPCVNKCPLISQRLFAGNAGGGALCRQTDAAGRPGDVHPPHRGSAGRPGGSGVK